MPNIVGVQEHPDNPEWVSLQFDDGSTSPLAHDPTGEFRQQARDVSSQLQGLPPPSRAGAVAAPFAGVMAPSVVAPAPAPAAPPPPSPVQPPGPPALPSGAPVSAQERAQLTAAPEVARLERAMPAAPASAPPAAPGAAPGMSRPPGMALGRVDQSTSSTGLTAEDRARVDEANRDAIEARRIANEADLRARTEQVNNEWNRLSEQEKQRLAEKATLEAQERAFTAKVDAQSKRLEEIAARPIDPSQAFAGDAGWYAFMAAFGDSVQNFGAALAGRGPVANPGATMERMIDRSVQLQTAQKEEDFKAGRITADQLNADRAEVRLKLTTAAKNLAETELAKARNADEKAALGAMRDKFTADQKGALAEAAMATARHEQTNEARTYVPAAPKAAPYTNAALEQLKRLGISPEDYEKGLDKKISEGEGAPSVRTAVNGMHQITDDLATLQAIAANNNNQIPTKGAIRVPDSVVEAAARLGIQDGMEAEQVNQIVQAYVSQVAKSYGGTITDGDREQAMKELGASGKGFERGLTRLYNKLNDGVRKAAPAAWPGRGQQVLDLFLGDSSRQNMPGLPALKSTPLGTENVDHTAPPETPEEAAARDRFQGLAPYPNESEEQMKARRKRYVEQQAAIQSRKQGRREIEEREGSEGKATRRSMTLTPWATF